MNGTVLVVGDAGIDVLASHAGPVVHGGDSPAAVRIALGGAAANTAAWLAHLGADPMLVGRIGDDLTGRLVTDRLRTAGVRTALGVSVGMRTCCVVTLVDRHGQRSMLPDRGAGSALRAGDLPAESLHTAAHLHLSGYVLLDPASRPAGLDMLRRAADAGLSTSVDPQAAALIDDPTAFLGWVRGVDLLLPNAAEVAALTGSAEPDAAAALLEVAGAVAVTHGTGGASWYGPAQRCQVPAHPARCVDSTGCGDAFDAGLLHHWLTGATPEQALRAGVAAGARAVGQAGAQPA